MPPSIPSKPRPCPVFCDSLAPATRHWRAMYAPCARHPCGREATRGRRSRDGKAIVVRRLFDRVQRAGRSNLTVSATSVARSCPCRTAYSRLSAITLLRTFHRTFRSPKAALRSRQAPRFPICDGQCGKARSGPGFENGLKAAASSTATETPSRDRFVCGKALLPLRWASGRHRLRHDFGQHR